MKILVTGAGTLIGNEICKFLLKKKHSIYASYRYTYPKNLDNTKIKLIKYNLKNNLNLKKNFDVLIHCAAAIPDRNKGKKSFMNINYIFFKNLVSQSLKLKCKKIIFLSTMAVYGNDAKKKVNERTKKQNLNSYGLSKLKSENYLINFLKKKNIGYSIFRLSGVLGKNSEHNFLSRTLKKIKEGKTIEIKNPNLKFNNAIHIKNLCEIISKSAKNYKEKKIYNLGSSDYLELIKIIKKMFFILKKKPKILIKKSKSKGFNICVKKVLKNNYKLYTIKKNIELFSKENM